LATNDLQQSLASKNGHGKSTRHMTYDICDCCTMQSMLYLPSIGHRLVSVAKRPSKVTQSLAVSPIHKAHT